MRPNPITLCENCQAHRFCENYNCRAVHDAWEEGLRAGQAIVAGEEGGLIDQAYEMGRRAGQAEEREACARLAQNWFHAATEYERGRLEQALDTAWRIRARGEGGGGG